MATGRKDLPCFSVEHLIVIQSLAEHAPLSNQDKTICSGWEGLSRIKEFGQHPPLGCQLEQ